ncbi:MAG: gamma-glutamyl-gamma-aminobutyrate hydrolase family protein [Erysipelotrichaceae bacterium]|nr:gamma-glutamyl-gamma-aminobutyrate hydrolase family protein [Erysipelotrichaceae bacterium]
MKLVGIVERAYYNKDNQKIMQINEAIRKAFSAYDEVCLIGILPTNEKAYVDMKMGEDLITKEDKKKLDYILNQCDGFIIPGGSSWYQFDEYIMKHAIEQDKPFLAICAGFQALCSMYAVDRKQFDMTSRLNHDRHYGEQHLYIHQNQILDGTLLKKIVKDSSIPVNSLHHDYVNFKFHSLRISAISEDGILEAVELSNHRFGLGIQWHPEYLMDKNSRKIFDKFIDSIK